MERMQTTIRLPVELMEQLKQEARKEKQHSRQMTLRMRTDLHEELQTIANQTGLTVSSLLIAAIWRSVLKPECLQR